MSDDKTPMLCPIKPHEMDRVTQRGMEDIARRVAGAAVLFNGGRDLLLLVYMAGIYHGIETQARRKPSTPSNNTALEPR